MLDRAAALKRQAITRLVVTGATEAARQQYGDAAVEAHLDSTTRSGILRGASVLPDLGADHDPPV